MDDTPPFSAADLDVERTWYVRYQGSQSVPSPVGDSEALKATPAVKQAYKFQERLQFDHRSYAVAALLMAVNPLGDTPDKKA